MPALILPRRFTQQPQGAVELAPEWLAAKPVFAMSSFGGTPFDAVTQKTATVNTADRTISDKGHVSDYSGTNHLEFAGSSTHVTGQVTIVAGLHVDAYSNYTHIVSRQTTTTQDVEYEFRHGVSAHNGTDLAFYRANATASNYRGWKSAPSPTGTGYKTVAVRSAPSGNVEDAPTFFENRRTISTASNAGTGVGAATATTADVWVGRRYDGVPQLDGQISFVFVFASCLSDSEISALSENPWQLFRAPPRRLYFGAAAATGIPTLSAAGMTNIAQTHARPYVTLTF